MLERNESLKLDGRVRKTTVYHFADCSRSTEIELEDGNVVQYSDSAPIPAGHSIEAAGKRTALYAALLEFHSGLFETTEAIHTWLNVRGLSFEAAFGRTFEHPVLNCHEIEDKDSSIKYRELR